MKRAGFDDRLDGIIVRAAIRLQERLKIAYASGTLHRYLKRTGLADDLDIRLYGKTLLSEMQDSAATLLAEKIRNARRCGTLRELLERFNMLELLPYTSAPPAPTKQETPVNRLRSIDGERKSRPTQEERELRRGSLTIVK